MDEDVIKINGRTMINIHVSETNITYVKNIMFGTLVHVFVKIENIQQVLWVIQRLRVMKLQNHMMKTWIRKLDQTMKLSRTMKQILMGIEQPAKRKILIFTCIFINYYSIIDDCQYLLLFDKISSKTAITISLQKQ